MTSGRRVRRRVEGRSRLQHRVHDHRQLARDRDRGALEADLLPQLEAPAPQGAVRAGAGQDRGRRLVDQRPEVPVAPPRDVAVVVGLARLVPAWRGVRPSQAPTAPDVLKFSGASTAATNETAVTAPTPGIVMSSRQAGLVRAAAISWRSSSAALTGTARPPLSSGCMTRARSSFVPSR